MRGGVIRMPVIQTRRDDDRRAQSLDLYPQARYRIVRVVRQSFGQTKIG
jgi:hypothetical protein